jgi:hypothetical protein
MDPSKKYVIVELNDGFKVEGVLTDVDKTNFTIHITEATKYRTDEKGNNIPEKLTSTELKISKADIKEVKLVQYDQLSSQKQTEERTLPQMNSVQGLPNQYTGLPMTQLPKLKDFANKYDKKDFFDSLSVANNKDQIKQTIRDNEKNKETFNLPEREYNNNNFQGNRGGYKRRGRGGQNRGGNYNNYNTNNNNRFGLDNEMNNNNAFNNFNNFNNYPRRGGYKFEGNRGGNRGGFNNGGRGGNRGGRGNRNFNNYNNFNNMNNNSNMNSYGGNNFNTFNDDNDDKCEERGKSIYDL